MTTEALEKARTSSGREEGGMLRPLPFDDRTHQVRRELVGHVFKLPPFLKLTNTDPFAAWFVVTGSRHWTGYVSCGRFLEPLAPSPSEGGMLRPQPFDDRTDQVEVRLC
jgi:hypothetical protein